MTTSPTKLALALLSLATFAALVTFVGCSSKNEAPLLENKPDGSVTWHTCTDKDHDGFGVACSSGQDCNDDDPKVTNECYACSGGQPKLGCPCAHDGVHARCGTVHVEANGRTTCGFGAATCSNGKWSDCVLDNAPGVSASSAGSAGGLSPLGLAGSPSSCVNNPCDPTCRTFVDTPDNSLSNDTGIDGTDAGLVIHSAEGGVSTWDAAPNGPINPSIAALLGDAGAMPEGGYFYHELTPGQSSAADPLAANTPVKYVDVYFLVDTAASMAPALSALGGAAAGPTGIVQQVRAAFPNARVGVGHFDGYQAAPVDVSPFDPRATRPYSHTLDLQASDVAAANVLTWLGVSGTTSDNRTQASNAALYASAAGTGLFAGTGTPYATSLGYWVNPRGNPTGTPAGSTGWDSDYGKWSSGSAASPPTPSPGEAKGPCADPTAVGYPCFSAGATPITVVMTGSPGELGPGGIFALPHGSADATPSATGGIAGSTQWPAATNVDSVHNGTEANAVTIDPSVFQRYRGSLTLNGAPVNGTMDNYNDSSVANGGSGTAPGNDASNFPYFVDADGATFEPNAGCTTGSGLGGREAFFKFTLTQASFLHFDTFGSEGDMSLYLFNQGTRKRVSCQDDVAWIGAGATGSVDGRLTLQSSLETYLKPGLYVLAVDEYGPPCPLYYSLDVATNRCYRSFPSTTWSTAESSDCGVDGTHLVTIRDATDNLFKTGTQYLIGLHNVAGTWQWADGTPYNAAFAATMWDTGQPSLATGDCVIHYTNNKWRSVACASGTYKPWCASAVSSSGQYVLQVNAMNDSAPVSVPSFEQMVTAQQGIGGKIIGIDVSGLGKVVHDAATVSGLRFDTCDNGNGVLPTGGPTNWMSRWSYVSLQEAARRTGSIDGTNPDYWTNPYVFALGNNGQPCHAADPPVGQQVVNAITNVATTLRQNVTVAAFDTDDLTDFDGTTGTDAGPTVLTPGNLNEGAASGFPYGVFVSTVTAVPVTNGTNGSNDNGPDGQKRCLDNPGTPDVIEQCLPDTAVRFDVTFTTPSSVIQLDVAQVFRFDVHVLGSGSGVLASTPAVIVVPPQNQPVYASGDWTRTFNVTGLCPPNSAPVWGLWSWTANTPADSKIDFFVTSANTIADLATAPELPLQFSNPPGPAANAGLPIGVTSANPIGSTFIQTTLALGGQPLYQPVLRVRGHFDWSTVAPRQSPVLQGWNLEYSCPDTQ